MRRLGLGLLFSLLSTACDSAPFDAPQILGGVSVEAVTLNRGAAAYKGYCSACHGDNGDGMGSQGLHQQIQPRDFRLGIIKFAGVPKGSVPRDQDIVRIADRGLKGTPMLPWGVAQADLEAIAQYTKTFSERRRREAPGAGIEPGVDGWASDPAVHRLAAGPVTPAVDSGRSLYHGRAGCIGCHPAYLPPLSESKSVPTDFGYILRATDFAHDTLKLGKELPDLYRVIAAGVGGTTMPTWKDQLTEKEIWALAYYVQHVAAYAGDRR
jgi:mono/diheme cytochrome c family protein